eukprot:scaffold2482_cov166-Amphora_coffeaeformis.AAC.19
MLSFKDTLQLCKLSQPRRAQGLTPFGNSARRGYSHKGIRHLMQCLWLHRNDLWRRLVLLIRVVLVAQYSLHVVYRGSTHGTQILGKNHGRLGRSQLVWQQGVKRWNIITRDLCRTDNVRMMAAVITLVVGRTCCCCCCCSCTRCSSSRRGLQDGLVNVSLGQFFTGATSIHRQAILGENVYRSAVPIDQSLFARTQPIGTFVRHPHNVLVQPQGDTNGRCGWFQTRNAESCSRVHVHDGTATITTGSSTRTHYKMEDRDLGMVDRLGVVFATKDMWREKTSWRDHDEDPPPWSRLRFQSRVA